MPADHKCARLHGHSFRFRVTVQGNPGAESGWIMDFGDIQDAVEPIRQRLDHRYLNEVEGLENPTSENLAVWLWQELAGKVPGLARIVVRETCRSGCVYEGPECDDPSGAGRLSDV